MTAGGDDGPGRTRDLPGRENGGREFGGRDIQARQVASGVMPAGEFTYCVVDTPGAGERRGKRRLRTRLRDGLLSERAGHPPVHCRILDQSPTGAKLQLHDDHALPRSFLLNDAAQRAQFRATLIWQNGRDAGVRLAVVGPLDPGEAPVKRPFFR